MAPGSLGQFSIAEVNMADMLGTYILQIYRTYRHNIYVYNIYIQCVTPTAQTSIVSGYYFHARNSTPTPEAGGRL